MAFIYQQATLTPTKLELLSAWLPSRPWVPAADDVQLEQLAAYRFDDPAGEVGMEGFLLRAGGVVLHVPLTYRGAPLAGSEQYLVGTTEHSTLGTRWVYDGCGDPVWVTAAAGAILTGGTQAGEVIEVDGHTQTRESSATVAGSGTPGAPVPEVRVVTSNDVGPVTVVNAGGHELTVVRAVGAELAAAQTLTGRWAGGAPVVLACLT